jgi:DNA helicase II / ATP-dependent DNA helicase PcrA
MLLELDHLNPEQRAAVSHAKGSLLVLAGAGSGKTRVITYRIARLIRDGLSPHEILGLSFTNKAAREMKERVINLVGKPGHKVKLSTFHSLGLTILREECQAVGLHDGFTILDEGDQTAAMKDLMKQAGYDTAQIDPSLVLSRISNSKSRLKAPTSGLSQFDDVAARLSGLYAQRLRAMNAVDFDDLIALPVWILKKSPESAHRWSTRYREILVDEYQDTNWAQLQLLKLLSQRYHRVIAVGDDDQSIYAWRGAEASNILQFDRHFPAAEMIALTQNYRSTNFILKAANAVIQNNKVRHEKSLWSNLGEGSKPEFRRFKTGDEEAQWVARDIRDKVKGHRIPASNIAILYRTNAQSRVFEESLTHYQIPLQIIGGTRFYDRKEIKDCVAYLRVVANPYDEAALRRIINFPARGIGDTTILKLSKIARENGLSLYRVLEKDQLLTFLDQKKRAAIEQFLGIISDIRTLNNTPGIFLGDTIRTLKSRLSMADVWLRIEESPKRVEQRMQNIDELANAVDLFQQRVAGAKLQDFLGSVSLDPRSDEQSKEPNDEVTLMTFHGAKGLEFDHVYMVGCEEGFLPHQRQPAKGSSIVLITPAELDEERRLAYVGITRARRFLTLTSTFRRIHRGKMKERRVSRFLLEIPETLLSGGHKGDAHGLKGDALDDKGRDAFAAMNRLFDKED